MAGGIQQDWNHAADWDPDHAVINAFGRLRSTVLKGKLAGSANLPARLSLGQQLVLTTGLERMAEGGVRPALFDEAVANLRYMGRHMVGPRTHDGWRTLAPSLGLRAGNFVVEDAIGAGRHFLLAQTLAMSAKFWFDPVKAILFCATHYGIEVTLRRKRRKPEPLKTEAFLHYFHEAIEHRLIAAMNTAEAYLPAAHTLDIGTASMQENRDMLAADLAIVAGIHVLGRPMYRVVLLQAKNATATGLSDMRDDDDRRQLDQLHSTGMGWYLFYPSFGRSGSFLPTARQAMDVFRDVWGDVGAEEAGAPHAYGNGRSPGWDFPSFVSIAMASDTDLTLGRLFPDAEAAAAALSTDRRTPLAAAIIAYDRTDSLRLRDFIDATADAGYEHGRLTSLPSLRRPEAVLRAVARDPFDPGW